MDMNFLPSLMKEVEGSVAQAEPSQQRITVWTVPFFTSSLLLTWMGMLI